MTDPDADSNPEGPPPPSAAANAPLPRRLLAWLEDRTGLGAWVRRWAAVPVPVAGGWRRVTGGLLLLLLLTQVVTGVALAVHYAPGATTAWGSVFFIEERVLLGGLVRGLHALGASAVVAVALLHLLRVGLERRYLPPRDALWLLGLLAAPLLAAFALTGYLLPWDQRGYWATQVAVGIARGTPVVGEAAARALQGGVELGTLTLTRFYALHVVVLPATLALVVLLALRLWRRSAEAAARGGGAGDHRPYWPGQAARDVACWAAVLAGLLALAATVGAGLEAPADPDSDFPPRPEWYFAPLRELLKSVPEPWGSVVLPGAILALLAALPWLDRGRADRRWVSRVTLGVPFAAWALLLANSALTDLGDRDYQERREAAGVDAALARRLARGGIPPEGAADMLRRHPPRLGRHLFELHCRRCHPLEGSGGEEAPDLTGYLTREWLAGVVRDPQSPRFFGNTDLDTMGPLLPEGEGDLPAIVDYLISLDASQAERVRPELAAAGRAAFVRQECNACHPTEAGEADLGPNLHDYGSEAWLIDFLRDPGQPHFYAEDNTMPGYADELDDEELRALAVFLRELGGR